LAGRPALPDCLPRFGKKSDGVAGFSAGKTTDKQPGLVAKENRFCCSPKQPGSLATAS